jgi:hypothetical protein
LESSHSIGKEDGIYLAEQRLAELPQPGSASSELVFILPPQEKKRALVTLRCQAWIPSETVSGSQDARKLGVQVYSIHMRGKGSGEKVFNANTGE